jgi:hypothetical protein
MSKKSVVCIATSRNQAERIVDHLKAESFSNQDISALFSDAATTHGFAFGNQTQARQGAGAGAGASGAPWGALGWIAGIGPLAVPGVGPFIAAGPLAAALRVAAGGGAVGGIAGALVGLGIPEPKAKRYATRVQEGNTLLSVDAEDVADIARAKDIFQQAGAQDICTAEEAATAAESGSEHVSPAAKVALA